MNDVANAVLYCVIQITMFSVPAAIMYLLVQRRTPSDRAVTVSTALLLMGVMTALACSPWPNWRIDLNRLVTDFGSTRHVSTPSAIGDNRAHNEVFDPHAENSMAQRFAANPNATVNKSNSDSHPSIDILENRNWKWQTYLVVTLISFVAFGILRFLMGLIAVRQLRRKTRPIADRAISQIANEILIKLERPCRFILCESDTLTMPAMIGWRQPLIILPVHWKSWSSDECRAVLAHELAHVVRCDSLTWMAAQLVLIFHFYHPFVHWLTSRLRLEQELAADATAAQMTGGRSSYLKILAGMALRETAGPAPWPSRAFLPTNGTLMRRIEMLREEKSVRSGMTVRMRTVMVVALVAACLGIAGLRASSADRKNSVDPSNSKLTNTNTGSTETLAAVEPAADNANASASTKITDERRAEIDAAIARLRQMGVFVREFHPRGDPQYWVQIITTGSWPALGSRPKDRDELLHFNDDAMKDVEIIARGVELQLHIRRNSITAVGLELLKTTREISALELTGSNIDDAMLSVLPSLPLTGGLALGSPQVTNAGIPHVAKCKNLTSLSLYSSSLSDTCLQDFIKMPKLQGIKLGSSFSPKSLEALARFPDLRQLEIGFSPAPSLDDLAKLKNLRQLSLKGKEYGDDSAKMIANSFPLLEQAYLRDTSITNVGVSHLSELKNLTVLTLDLALVDDGIAESIRKMKKLEWLSLNDCSVGDPVVAAAAECPKLRTLFLINTDISDKSLGDLSHLTNLYHLQISLCEHVTDESIGTFMQFANSGDEFHLGVQNTGITFEAARRLQEAKPRMQVVWGVSPVSLK
ncbi:MAG: M56 family metallopeptidase [Planctomycetaceae bacterium]